ncbi:hypothetical protein [Streptomyces sp. NPDC002328]|uniref:hypothetical protein n=1 Tax=Streptomyces sp. NPDC002328 TaxID=3364642 RepID=UPI0036BA5412
MSPDLRTPPRLFGPSARAGFRKAGMAATLALVLAAGAAGPATAAASAVAGPAATTVTTPDDGCEPGADKPDHTKPGPAKPHHDAPGYGKPHHHDKPAPAKPAHDKPGHTKPGPAKPANGKPAHDKPVGHTKPGNAEPTALKPGQTKPEGIKPGQTKPGNAKPSSPKPSQAKPSSGKPGQTKPGNAKPTAHKPGQTKPGNAKPALSTGKPKTVAPGAGDKECKGPKDEHPHGHGNGNGYGLGNGHGHGNGHGNGHGPAGPAGPCSDIDALRPEAGVEYRSVLTGGRYYAGVRDITDSGDGTMLWTDLTGNEGYPAGGPGGLPCGAALAGLADTDTVAFDVLTTTGRVYEITCTRETNDNDASILDCTDEVWEEVSLRPRPGALNSGVDPDA